MYDITYSMHSEFTWFRIPKNGTRTFVHFLREKTTLNKDGLNIPYIKFLHKNNFKFCFIRNPWDRVVSCYSDKVKGKLMFEECWDKDFDYFIKYINTQDHKKSDIHIRAQYTFFPSDSIDYIAKFENYEKEFDFIINQKLNLNCVAEKRNKSKHKHYTEYYTDKSRRLIEKIYRNDVELGNYKFGE